MDFANIRFVYEDVFRQRRFVGKKKCANQGTIARSAAGEELNIGGYELIIKYFSVTRLRKFTSASSRGEEIRFIHWTEMFFATYDDLCARARCFDVEQRGRATVKTPLERLLCASLADDLSGRFSISNRFEKFRKGTDEPPSSPDHSNLRNRCRHPSAESHHVSPR